MSKQALLALVIGACLIAAVLSTAPVHAVITSDPAQQISTPTPGAGQASAAPAIPDATNSQSVTITHVVQAGETVWSLAAEYGVTIDSIVELNRLEDPESIQIGQRLTILLSAPAIPLSAPVSSPIQADEPAVTPEATLAANQSTQPFVPGADLLCPQDVEVFPLSLPADPIRIVLVGELMYLVAGGDLYRLSLDQIGAASTLTPQSVMPANRQIGRFTIRELVYATADPQSGDLLLLDKSNDIYRFADSGQWRMEFPATPIPNQFPDPQFLALQPLDTTVYALDADLSHIWRLLPGSGLPRSYWPDARLLAALDMLMSTSAAGDLRFDLLLRNGSVLRLADGGSQVLYTPARKSGTAPWPAHLTKLGEWVGVIDAQERSVTALDPESGSIQWQALIRLPGLQRLRSAALQGSTLYAVAGRSLYMLNLTDSGECKPVVYDDAPYYQGRDIQALLPDVAPPFTGVIMPDRLRSYPGARRLYRYGVHEGVDIYSTDAPGVGYRSPIFAIADGVVVRADTDFIEMTPAEYEAAIDRTEREHQTPPDLWDQFLGRQVHVEHSAGIESRYSHLSGVARNVSAGIDVTQGQPVGHVGVSGTSSGAYGTTDGVHLHFEVWIDGEYLGQGLTLYETMRLWQALFE